eukprot:15464591-Alexandrium_andersonii.AAC.1
MAGLSAVWAPRRARAGSASRISYWTPSAWSSRASATSRGSGRTPCCAAWPRPSPRTSAPATSSPWPS